MSPEKMIGLSFAAPAAKLYEVLDKLCPPAGSPAGGLSRLFFQRGELLAADAVGVPADEIRGDEDEHRAHGRAKNSSYG